MTEQERQKQIKNYLYYDKQLNALDFALWRTDEYFFDVNGKTEQERNLLAFLEREIHDLQYTIQCLKNEFEENRFNLEEKKED